MANDGIDDAPALQAAIDSGLPVCVPPGRFIVGRALEMVRVGGATVLPGFSFQGSGPLVTVFENRVAGSAMIRADTTADNRFLLGVHLAGFTIEAAPGVANSSGIQIHRAWQVSLRDLHIDRLSGSGVLLPVAAGDPDGSIMVTMERVYIFGCRQWGISNVAGTGINELSFLRLSSVFVNSCGTAETPTAGRTWATYTPNSGGMRWRGQILDMVDCAFTVNQNVGLLIYGGAGVALNFTARGTDWENNIHVGLRVEGLQNGHLDNCQFFSNAANPAEYGVVIDPVATVVRNLVFSGTVVRAVGLPGYTAFEIHRGAEYTVIQNTMWGSLDSATQTRFNDQGTLTRIEDDGRWYPHPQTLRRTTLSSSMTTYQPDARRAALHYVELTGAGGSSSAPSVVVIQAPTAGGAANEGLEFTLDVHNRSAGTWRTQHSGYVTFPIVTLAPGQHLVARFYFNNTVGWLQTSELVR